MGNFSEIFGFLITLKETLKILPKNWKFTASIAILTLTLPSILLSVLIYVIQSLISYTVALSTKPSGSPDSSLAPLRIVAYWAPVLALEIVFFLILNRISHLSGFATILVSANSYIGNNNLTTKDLFSSIKRTWRSPSSTSFRLSRRSSTQYLSAAMALAVFLPILYPNFITIGVAVVAVISVVIMQLYSSVVWALSMVVSVLEYSTTTMVEVEKAEKLVQGGQHLHGFMLNLFVNLLGLIIFVGFWMVVGDKGTSLNMMIYGLFFINFLSLFKMFVFMAYTVFYFECKKHQGEEIIGFFGNFLYSGLPSDEIA